MPFIHVVNPNSTTSVTERAAQAARQVVGGRIGIVANTVTSAPASIEGYHDEAVSVPAMLDTIRNAEVDGAVAHVLACFDDPGLFAAREVAARPVIGSCQAAVQVAVTIASRFSIITTLPRSVPIIEDLVDSYGATRQCRRVRSVNLPVLTFESETGEGRRRLLEEARRALDEDGAEAIVLGCAGMSDLTDWLTEQTGAPVVEGVTAAVRLASALSGGYKTSKLGAFAFPRSKDKDLAEIA